MEVIGVLVNFLDHDELLRLDSLQLEVEFPHLAMDSAVCVFFVVVEVFLK